MKNLLLTIAAFLLLVPVAHAQYHVNKNRPEHFNGTNFRHPIVDRSTRASIAIENWYHEIIDGNHYFLDGAFGGVGSGVTKAFGVTAPSSTTKIHMVFAIGGSGKTTFEMYEAEAGSTLFNGGTAVTPRNSNRGSSDASTLTVVSMPNHVQSGVSTMLFNKIVGTSGQNQAQAGMPGSGSRDSKILFAPGKKYFVLFTSGAADNNINYTAEWLEQSPLN